MILVALFSLIAYGVLSLIGLSAIGRYFLPLIPLALVSGIGLWAWEKFADWLDGTESFMTKFWTTNLFIYVESWIMFVGLSFIKAASPESIVPVIDILIGILGVVMALTMVLAGIGFLIRLFMLMFFGK